MSGNKRGCPRAMSSDLSEMTWDQGWKVDNVPYRHKGGGPPSVNEDRQNTDNSFCVLIFVPFVHIPVWNQQIKYISTYVCMYVCSIMAMHPEGMGRYYELAIYIS